VICADTSFFISFYGNDLNTAQAQQLMAEVPSVCIHRVVDFEFANAVRLLVFRGNLTSFQAREMMEDYNADRESGLLENREVSLLTAYDQARTLSTAHTETLGNRAYDILHVAAAKPLGATKFWSFDGKQRSLASVEGLDVGP
jgi:predicted nucleic acid-binding protein